MDCYCAILRSPATKLCFRLIAAAGTPSTSYMKARVKDRQAELGVASELVSVARLTREGEPLAPKKGYFCL
jgi:hypothetical protein